MHVREAFCDHCNIGKLHTCSCILVLCLTVGLHAGSNASWSRSCPVGVLAEWVGMRSGHTQHVGERRARHC